MVVNLNGELTVLDDKGGYCLITTRGGVSVIYEDLKGG